MEEKRAHLWDREGGRSEKMQRPHGKGTRKEKAGFLDSADAHASNPNRSCRDGGEYGEEDGDGCERGGDDSTRGGKGGATRSREGRERESQLRRFGRRGHFKSQ
ncbi:hypothetical protein ACLOJK_040831 [Asimina triloba]